MIWCRHIKGNVRRNESLKNHTTFRIGGRAQYFIEPRNPGGLKELLALLKKERVPFLIIGAGSNILACDEPLKKAIIRLSAPAFRKIGFFRGALEVGAGVRLSRLLSYTIMQGLAGCEFLAGIPGTLGGAIRMNAGISFKPKGGALRQWNIADILESVTVMDTQGKLIVLPGEAIRFGYRTSGLQRFIIVSGRLKVKKGRRQEIRRRIQDFLIPRAAGQDISIPSAGCVFKNPPGKSAGRLIEECGLKGARINDARVSTRHANFIVNYGCARAKDVLQLISLIKKRVQAKYGILLEPEITIWK